MFVPVLDLLIRSTRRFISEIMDLQLTNCIAVFLHNIICICRYQCDDLESCKLLVHKKCKVSQHVMKITDFITNFVENLINMFVLIGSMIFSQLSSRKLCQPVDTEFVGLLYTTS